VPELLGVLDFTPVPVPYLTAETPAPGVTVFRPDVPDFVLYRVHTDATVTITGPAIVICTSGALTVTGASSSIDLERGSAAYVTPDEGSLHLSAGGTVFLATTGSYERPATA
jgi:mannose-6-phosphate isomerase